MPKATDIVTTPAARRRKLLAMAPLAAVAATIPAAAAGQVQGDQELIALGAIFRKERDYFKALPDMEQENDASYDRYWAAMDRMAEIPARSPVGLGIKASAIREYDHLDATADLVKSLLADIERIAGGVA